MQSTKHNRIIRDQTKSYRTIWNTNFVLFRTVRHTSPLNFYKATAYYIGILKVTDVVALCERLDHVKKSRKPSVGQSWLKSIATYDFSPQFSAKVRRLVGQPLGILVMAGVVAFLCGLFLQTQAFVLCGGVLLVLVLGVAWPWFSLRGLVGLLTFEQHRCREGETIGVRLQLRNRLPWPAWGVAIQGGLSDSPSSIVAGVASVPRRRVALCRWQFTPICRGQYPRGAVSIATGFPFGLWVYRRVLPVAAPLLVWPRVYPVGPIPPVSGSRQVEGNVSRNKVGSHGDVLGVRPYRRGDSPRRIHWAQSARHDRLIVCELQSNSRPVIQLVLDAEPKVHVGEGGDSSREWAIRIVASLAAGWLQEGAMVGLACGGVDLPPASGPAQLIKVLDALAALPDATPQPLVDLLACAQCSGFRDGLQVIVTTDLTHAHGGCTACQAEDQRWVVLHSAAFAAHAEPRDCHHCPEAWLKLDSIAEIPQQLLGGWREARHGS